MCCDFKTYLTAPTIKFEQNRALFAQHFTKEQRGLASFDMLADIANLQVTSRQV